MRIFMALMTLYAVSHIYLFVCLRRAFGGGIWQIPVSGWLLVMALSWFFRFGRQFGPIGERFYDLSAIWMGLCIFLCYSLIAADLAALLTRILAWLTQYAPLRSAANWLSAPRYIPVALLIGVGLFLCSVYEAYAPRIRQVPLTTHKLPAGSPPVRIAAIADVHLSSLIGPWMLSRHVAAINELQPDLVVICGDLVDTNMTERDEDAALLRSLQTQHGAIAVTGNHENYRGLDMSLNFMEKAGLTVLRGQWMECGDIVVAGVDDDSFAGRFTPDTSDVARTLSSAPQDKFILLLRHQPHVNPDMIGQFDIQFSGHTHSGQLWPGMAFTRRIFGVGQGLTELTHGPHRSLLYVTNGIGYWGPPIRFLAPPEIVVFTLSPAE